MKTSRNKVRFSNFRTVALPSFLKQHIKRKSDNISKYIRDLLKDYYQVIEAYSLREDVKTVFLSLRMEANEQNQLVDMVNSGPHISACDLIRTMIWMDYIRDKKLQKAKNPYPVEKDFVRVPMEDSFIDYKIIGEA